MLLCMPDAQRLDMATKYSAEPYSTRLIEVRKGFVWIVKRQSFSLAFTLEKLGTLLILQAGVNDWSYCFSLLPPGK